MSSPKPRCCAPCASFGKPCASARCWRKKGQPARWEMLRVHHRGALETGSTTSQVTALSLLVSMYLQSVYAATSEEIEIFLSPVASRSRVREAVRGLSATRQLHALSMAAQTYHFLENGLPEFAPPSTASDSAETEASHPSTPVERPRPRKIQATARPNPPAASMAAPSTAVRSHLPPAQTRAGAPARVCGEIRPAAGGGAGCQAGSRAASSQCGMEATGKTRRPRTACVEAIRQTAGRRSSLGSKR